MFSNDFASNLIFVKSCSTVSLCFYGQNYSKFQQNLFYALLNNPINEKNRPYWKEEKKPKGVKDRGEGESRVGMTAFKDSMVFFKASLKS